MIERQIAAEVAAVVAHDGSAVTYIHNVYALFNKQSDDRARATLIKHVMATLCEGFHRIQEIRFCFFVSINDSLSRILWKLLVFYNKLMKIVAKEVGASVSSMAIKHSKELIAALEFQVSYMGVFHGTAPALHPHGHILDLDKTKKKSGIEASISIYHSTIILCKIQFICVINIFNHIFKSIK